MRTLLRQASQSIVVASICVVILLVWLHVLPAIALPALELVLLVAAVWMSVRIRRRYRLRRSEGMDVWQALEDSLALLLPRRAASLVALEPRIWFCLFRWFFRRRGSDPDTFGYSQGSSLGVFVIALLFSAPVETLLFELVIPWHWLKVLFLMLDVYSIVWLLGFAAALTVLPHRLAPTGLHVSYGVGAQGFIPYTAIVEVRRERLTTSRRDGCHVDQQHHTASISVGGVTTVTLRLREPVTLQRIFGPTPPITTLHLTADSPDGFVAAVERRLTRTHDLASLVGTAHATL